MSNKNIKHKAIYYLQNFHCGLCETGVVQLHMKQNRNKEITTTVSGCLDCGHSYGIKQAEKLKFYEREDIVWN